MKAYSKGYINVAMGLSWYQGHRVYSMVIARTDLLRLRGHRSVLVVL